MRTIAGRFDAVEVLDDDGDWRTLLAHDSDGRLVELHVGAYAEGRVDEQELAALVHAPKGRTLAPVIDATAEWLAFAHAPRVSIARLLDAAPEGLAVPLACTLIRDVATDLAAVHERQFVHRWITGARLAVGVDGRVRLDWRATFALREASLAMRNPPAIRARTLESLSPEQLRGQNVGPPADVHALGVALAWMVTGRHPFRRASELECLRAIVDGLRAPLLDARPDAPAELVALVDDMLALDPARRPPARAVAERIARDLPWAAWTDAQMADEARALAPAEVARVKARAERV